MFKIFFIYCIYLFGQNTPNPVEAGTPPQSPGCQLGCLDQQEGLQLIHMSQHYAREMGSDPISLMLAMMSGCFISMCSMAHLHTCQSTMNQHGLG